MPSARIQAVQPSATLRITALAKELQAKGESVINLAAGEPDFDTPPAAKDAAIQAIREGFTKYTPTTGIPQLKSAVAEYLKKSRNLSYRPDQVAVTNGAKQAIYNLLQVLVEPGDEVLIPAPYWLSYPEMVRLAGATPVFVPTLAQNRFHLEAKAMERSLTPQTKCLILNSPSNPTGAVLPEAALRDIGEAARKHSLWVISDEIYSELVFDGRHASIAAVVPDLFEKTLVVDGVSKSFAMTGWRIGFLAGPKEIVEAAGRLQDHSTSNPSSISQKAALGALSMDSSFRDEMRKEFAGRRDLVVKALQDIPGITFVKPEGAFYCFVDISKTGMGASVFAEKLLQEAKVALIPGEAFGAGTYVRISFAVGRKDLQEGLSRLGDFIRRAG